LSVSDAVRLSLRDAGLLEGFKGKGSRRQEKALGEGFPTDARAADELSCSPSAASDSGSVAGASSSTANRLAARPWEAFVGVFGD
jgi:hypothetical protein